MEERQNVSSPKGDVAFAEAQLQLTTPIPGNVVGSLHVEVGGPPQENDFQMRLTGSLALLVLVLATGCNHEKVEPAHPAAASAAPPATTATPPARDVSGNQKVSDTLAVSGDIVRLCGIKATPSGASTRFAFDKADLGDDDHNILQQLATCMRTGPLQGKTVELIGRADPRGTAEYNLALGSHRAGSVNSYLQSLGVEKTSLAQTSRGALDATGTDEAGWANDRRVDIMLKQS